MPAQGELTGKTESQKWGFPQNTLITDSQSAAPLRNKISEQVFYRMFLMGKPSDIALVNYPIDSTYLGYLNNTLKVPIPEIVQIPNTGSGFLTGDILQQPETLKTLHGLIHQKNFKIQFFNLTPDEVVLAKVLSNPTHVMSAEEATQGETLPNPTYIKNLEVGEYLGTKTGFREFCEANSIQMPPGKICQNFEHVVGTIAEDLKGSGVVIKSFSGTGGAELGSNVQISADELAKHAGDIDQFLSEKMTHLSPSEPPYVVEQKLELPEASLHIFLDDKGNTVIEPVVFGQFAHEGSYVGGHHPNGFTHEFNKKIKKLAKKTIIPALKKIGATGMHCMDFLYDEKTNEFYFIEDNTRPGALDFISHFVNKVASTHKLENPAWYHYNLPIKQITQNNNVTFEEIMAVLGDSLTPGDSFVLVSNPNVLPYGGDLHLTGVTTGGDSSPEAAKQAYMNAVEKLKAYYKFDAEIHIP
jgi:hypothetical protein